MAKFVCDFDTVNQEANNLCNSGKELTTATSSYDTKITSDLSGWNSSASTVFSGVNKGQVAEANAISEYANSLGEFILKASKAIEQAETELSSIRIK